ncbi:MAG TPA: hypothetical protein VGB61_05035 [Pyrinomonadaceae bacterium]|jgi:hypothetical protein
MKAEITKSVLGVALGLLVFGVMPSATRAQSQSSRSQAQAIADEQKRTGITTFYYAHKSNATGKLNAEQRRGKYARMYYSDARRQWAVDVSNGLANGGSTSGGGGTSASTNPNWSADGGNLPNGASVIYFPTKASAEGIYKASLRQGDWAKMWYDARRKEWAVAVKPR